MAYIKISQLPGLTQDVLPLTAGDVMPIVHGPVTYKVTLSGLQEYFTFNQFQLWTVLNYLSSNNVLLSGISFNGILSGGVENLYTSFGTGSATGLYSVAEGIQTRAFGEGSHAEGDRTLAIGVHAHTEGQETSAFGDYSHAEGVFTEAHGDYSHVEGEGTIAHGKYAHAEGYYTVADGDYSTATGYQSEALGFASHTEGDGNIASGWAAHAEGQNNVAEGFASHASGDTNVAKGDYAIAGGTRNIAYGHNTSVDGAYVDAHHDDAWMWKGSSDTAYLSSTREKSFTVSADGGVDLIGGINLVGPVTADGPLYVKSSVIEDYSSLQPVSLAVNINLLESTTFNVLLSSNVTSFNITNYVENKTNSFIVFLQQDNSGGKTVNWTFTGKTLKWVNGVAPTITSTANAIDVFTFISNDGGSTWFGFNCGLNFL